MAKKWLAVSLMVALAATASWQAWQRHLARLDVAEARQVAVLAWQTQDAMASWVRALSALRSKCLASDRPMVFAALEIGEDGEPERGRFLCGPEKRES